MSVLGVDIGTSRCKAAAFNLDGKMLAMYSREYQRLMPLPGRYEILPSQLISALESIIADVAAQVKRDPIEAISFSVFGGSFVPLDSDFNPLGNLISTADNRGLPDMESWLESFTAERTYQITGIIPHTSEFLIKAIACSRTSPDIYERTAMLASAEEFVYAHLGIVPVVDRSTASTYMAYDIKSGDWSAEILDAAGICRSLLAPIVECGSVIGRLSRAVSQRLGLSGDVVVVAGGHDQQVAALGAGQVRPGIVTDSLGTVEAMSAALESPELGRAFMQNNLPNWCHVYNGLFCTAAYNYSCADLLNWAARVFYGAQAGDELELLKRGLAEMPDAPSSVLVQPHFCGSGTPYMDAVSRGAIVGLDLSVTREQLMRAIVDCQNYEMRLNMDIWRKLGISADSIRVFGGLAQNDRILQIKADILDAIVTKVGCSESGCLGAAALAASGAGLVESPVEFLNACKHEERVFTPRKEFCSVHQDMYGMYRRLYGSLKSLTTNDGETAA
jgi:xylulokinase